MENGGTEGAPRGDGPSLKYIHVLVGTPKPEAGQKVGIPVLMVTC
jgi:hypothetical protein